MVEIIIDVVYTNKSEEAFNRYEKSFSEVIEAEMVFDDKKVNCELILTNKFKDRMRIKSGLTSGYIGEGPHGTLRVLKKCGFDVDEEFIHTYETFKLKK